MRAAERMNRSRCRLGCGVDYGGPSNHVVGGRIPAGRGTFGRGSYFGVQRLARRRHTQRYFQAVSNDAAARYR